MSNPQPTNIPMKDALPPYEPGQAPVVHQPMQAHPGYNNPGYETGPLYVIQGGGSSVPAFAAAPAMFVVANPLDANIPINQRLTFHQNQSLGARNGSAMVQVRGSQNQVVVSILMNNNTSVSHQRNARVYEITQTIQYSDPSGTAFMISRLTSRTEHTVTTGNGGKILGVIDGLGKCCYCIPLTLTGHGNNGTIFEVTEEGNEFKFVDNGNILAVAKKNNSIFGFEIQTQVNGDTKGMILAGAFSLFVMHFAKMASCSIL